MRKNGDVKTIFRIIGMVLAGTVMALLTIAVIYGVFWFLMIISSGIISVCKYILEFLETNWASSLGIIGMLAVGIIEFELIILPRFHRNSPAPNSDENSEEDSDEEEDDDDEQALAYLKSFDPDSED